MATTNKAEELAALKLELEIAKLQREELGRLEQEEMARKGREIGSQALLKQWEQEKLVRSQCPHLKQNGQSALAGQRDHHNHYHFICAFCAEEWTDNEVPLHLRIPLERIGGPDVN